MATVLFLHEYIMSRLISSRGHSNDIFANARGSWVLLNMRRINIENRVRTKSIFEFGLLHQDVAPMCIELFHPTINK